MSIKTNTIGFILDVVVWNDDTNAARNISAASTKNIIITYPSGRVLTIAASFKTNGTDGMLTHTTTAGQLNEPGVYKIKAYVVTPSFEVETLPVEMLVVGEI